MGLFRNITNLFRKAYDDAGEATENVAVNAEYDIKDSKKEILEYRKNIAEAMAANKDLERQANEAQEKADKYNSIAEKAMAAGNESDAEEALMTAVTHEESANTLKSELTKNRKLVSQMRTQLKQAEQKIAQAEIKHKQQVSREGSLKIREAMGKSAQKFGGGGALGRLDDYDKKLQEREDKLNAMEELSVSESEALEEKYSSSNDTVSKRLAALKKKSKKTK